MGFESGSSGPGGEPTFSSEQESRLVFKPDSTYAPREYSEDPEDEPLEDDYDEPDPEVRPEVLEAQEAITYSPFDASEELRGVRKFSPEEEQLDPDERQKVIWQRLDGIRQALETQQLGVGQIVRDLYTQIEQAPDTSQEELWEVVTQEAERYRLNEDQLEALNSGIREYVEKHDAVEKYREMYPDDAELFAACFGSPPGGHVEVVKGSMSLLFRCRDGEDYALAYNDGEPLSDAERRHAYMSGGVAVVTCHIKELNGAVTAENGMHASLARELTERNELIAKARGFYPPNLRSLTVTGADGHEYVLNKTALDNSEDRLRLTLVDTTRPDRPLFDVIWAGDKVANARDESRLFDNCSLESDDKRGFGIWVDPASYLVTPHKGMSVKVHSEAIEYSDKFGDGPGETQVHEDQHQFNKLFSHLDSRMKKTRILESAVETEQPLDTAVDKLLTDTVRLERQALGIDQKAREEMLAFYAEGQEADEILQILETDPLYDYRDRYSEDLAELPANIETDLQKDIAVLAPDGNYAALQVDHEQVNAKIDLVFGSDYKEDLAKWTGAIKMLEDGGYTRQEVLSLLYQEPANNWLAMARRLAYKG